MSMGVFYITVQDTGERYELSTTTAINVSEESKISSHKVETREIISTNAVAYNKEISYNGVISNIRRVDQNTNKDVAEYLEGLSNIRTSKLFVTCNIDDRLNPITDCLIQSLSANKTTRDGLSTWTVAIKLKQVRLSNQASVTRVPVPKLPDTTEKEKNLGNSSTKEVPEPLTETMMLQGTKNLGGIPIPEGG